MVLRIAQMVLMKCPTVVRPCFIILLYNILFYNILSIHCGDAMVKEYDVLLHIDVSWPRSQFGAHNFIFRIIAIALPVWPSLASHTLRKSRKRSSIICHLPAKYTVCFIPLSTLQSCSLIALYGGYQLLA